MVMAKSVGWVLQTIGGYGPIFMVCGGIYVLALIVVQVLTPKYEPVKV
jgi:ACS family hexuronate transporter-like MFS transporter